jgi:BRO1-like domain
MFAKLDKPLLNHIAFQSQLYKALAHRFLALNAWSKDDYGIAIAHLNAAVALLKQKGQGCMPPLEGALQSAASDLNMLRADVSALLASYAKDNSSIYYASVPAEPEPLPEPLVSDACLSALCCSLIL